MSRVRVAYTAGEAIGPDLFLFYRSLGINLKQLYGMTESSVFLCIQKDGEVKPDTVGPPIPGVELRVAEDGEVLFRSPGAFQSYYKNAEATAEAKEPDGWVHTGDAGFFGADGQLRIIDRARDVGHLAEGSLFAPKFIENKLKFFPYIKEAVAFGDQRDFVTAFVNIDLEAAGNWAERHSLAYGSYQELAGNELVGDLVQGCIEEVNRDLAAEPTLAASQIRRFLILHKELDADDGELTRTRKVRRRTIAERYGSLIEAPHSAPRRPARKRVIVEDGRKGTMRAELTIRDVMMAPCGREAALSRRARRSDRMISEKTSASRSSKPLRSASPLVGCRRCRASASTSGGTRSSRSSGRTAPARPRCSMSSTASITRSAARCAGRARCAAACGRTPPPRKASLAPFRMSRCSAACRPSTTS
jgi:long-chain acyl-CoA synthetase